MKSPETIDAHLPKPEIFPLLPELKPGSRVLLLGPQNPADVKLLQAMGFDPDENKAEGPALLFYQPAEASFDAVWINGALNAYASEPAQRVIANCFRGLKPGGLLAWVAYEGAETVKDPLDESRTLYLLSEKQYCSLLEQSGFRIKKVGRKPSGLNDPLPKLLIFANRI